MGVSLARRQRLITLVALGALAILAWVWIVMGAGMNMAAQVEWALFPHRNPGMAMEMAWDLPRFLLTLSMWWVMMIAMMVPAAAPVILLYARAAGQQTDSPPATVHFLLGYLIAWLFFSAIATGLQVGLELAGLMTSMGMTSTRAWLSGAVLIIAGIYQFTPGKDACLSHCRSPAQFLAQYYRPGRIGALRLGLVHGSYCVGCCWALMALLFVGGVMNLVWIAALTLMVAAEKLLARGPMLARIFGVIMIIWGAATLLV